MNLLEVQSSARLEKSVSRTLSDNFIHAWQVTHPQAHHQRRDIGSHPPAHPTQLWTTANYTQPEDRSPAMTESLKESEQLIEELLWADRLLLGVPMYNFSIPSTFKTYLDNIVRVNRTFTFDPINHTFAGLATGKKALIITPSAGNFSPGTPLGHLNFCETYVCSILRFIGIEDTTVVAVPHQFMPNERQQHIENAHTQLMNLAANW
ncbi:MULTISPECIES: FMN-dependent NADH-azoreductase [Cyanophyceae]|uniref:FMN-dependent NADH-azoreductase n=1 Tax=Cyanophyceae TaxID=3028117 RepID=UPI0002A6655F|nr:MULTISPECIES: NAD(P)H-dependent oxidoreductase [Cyanophyceae]AFZ33473.1 FMN-dependent NADH-azoreductase [Gloeocapsa sp. PCC 7428]